MGGMARRRPPGSRRWWGPSSRLLATSRHLFFGFVDGRHDRAGARQENLTLLGELRTARGTSHQCRVQLAFQSSQRAADARDGLNQAAPRRP